MHRAARKILLCAGICSGLMVSAIAQTVTVGAGSYTTTLPAGVHVPQSQIYNTMSGPIMTHKFWTAKNWFATNLTSSGGPYNMVPHPLAVQTTPSGLMLGFDATITQYGSPATAFYQSDEDDLTLGVAGLNATSVPVSGATDWTVDFNFGPITTRVGRGMPFVYAFTNGSNPTVTFSGQPTVFANNGNILGVSIANNNYGLFCPTGGTWSGVGGTVLTCNLPSGHNYFSLALLPNQAALSTYAQYAFSFPTNTQVSWNYNQSSSQVTTTYTVTTQAEEGTQTGTLMALYPHQYVSLQGTINTSYTYPSPVGTLEVEEGTSFTTVNTYPGVIPFLPPTGNYDTATMQSDLNSVATETNQYNITGTDTYDVGKDLARIAHLLPIASAVGDTADFNSLETSLEGELQNWYNGPANNQTTNVFYYDKTWGTLIGYPSAYGSASTLNDHHFHYGYWIHASAILGLFNPSWIQTSSWGGMVNMLARDIATPVRNDTMFPFLRHFDVYAGHSWASGQAPFGDGVNEESSSEAVNAWTGLILYATETGNTQLRDAAIWMYTLETNSVFDYWFNDGPIATFPSGFPRVAIANIFDDKGDTGTWFSGQIEMEHGIEFLPFHGGSLYLGRDPAYVQKNLAEVTSFDANAFSPSSTNWPDLMEEYEAFYDPTTAISQWTNTSFVFDGESKAHQYYWLQNLQTLGQVDESVTADTPLYAVFNNNGSLTHVAYNTTTSSATVTFSDGTVFSVPAGTLMSEKGTLTTGPGTTSGTSGSGGGGSTEAPFGGTPATIAGTVMAENYDTGGQGVAYNVASINGSDNAYRSDGVDLELSSAPATGNDIGWTAAGQWFRYTVNVSTAGTYTVSFLVAGGGGAAVADAFHLSNAAGTNLTGAVAVPNTGGWQAWTTVTATVTLPAGVQTLTLNQDAGGWNINSMTFAAVAPNCSSAPSAPTGLAASGTSSSGTSLTWTADTAPSNCSISSYTVLENGSSVGTATGTSFAVTGLSASTTYSFTVEATDAAGTSPASSVLTVTTPAASSTEAPYGGTPAAIAGTVMAENYDTGGQGVAYNVTSINGSDNAYRSDGVDLELSSAPATGNDIGWTAAGQWFRYTVNVATSGTYTVTFLVSDGSGAAVADAFHLSNAAGTNLSGAVAVPNTGGWQAWTTVTATVTLPAGVQTLTLNQDAAGWNINSMAFALNSGSSAYNVNGIYTDGTSFTTGGLDNDGYAYSSSQLGTTLSWSGSTFTFGTPNVPDVYSSETIPLTSGQYSTLQLLATGVNGDQASQTFTVTYTDGTTTTITQSLSDWFTPQSYTGESIVKTMTYRDTSAGTTSAGSPNLYGYSFSINSAKTVQSLTLPNNRNVVVLAYALVAPASSTTSGSTSISAGGPASGSFVADTDYSGGTTASTTATIDTSLISAPVPPQSVFQNERQGVVTYTLPGFTPGAAVALNLYFAEINNTAAGQRQFNVIINGNTVLTNFDIFANTGAANKAIQQNFSATANSSGQVIIQLTTGSAGQPQICGITATGA